MWGVGGGGVGGGGGGVGGVDQIKDLTGLPLVEMRETKHGRNCWRNTEEIAFENGVTGSEF